MESSQVWKIEKVTVLTDSWLVTRVWDTDMLGFQMTRMGNTYIPSLDSNRMWKSIVF